MSQLSLLDRDDAHRSAPGSAATFDISVFHALLDNARAALAQDPGTARACLDQLAALLGRSPALPATDLRILPAIAPVMVEGTPAKGGLAPWQLRRTMDYIQEHIAGPVPVATLARLTRLSSGHFCRAFKTALGHTPHKFLIRERIRRAQMLMLGTQDSLSDIACACGLTDQAHLTRLFRQLIGETPLNWRRTQQNLHV